MFTTRHEGLVGTSAQPFRQEKNEGGLEHCGVEGSRRAFVGYSTVVHGDRLAAQRDTE